MIASRGCCNGHQRRLDPLDQAMKADRPARRASSRRGRWKAGQTRGQNQGNTPRRARLDSLTLL